MKGMVMNPVYYQSESLSQDAIHGYLSFSSPLEYDLPGETSSERDLIDSPWIQRLRQIHQLQTAWLVYPTAEHSRFQHVLGAMYLASRVWSHLSVSFFNVFTENPDLIGTDRLPSNAYIESLLRIAALLHDVGHGPFGHFFDSSFLCQYRTPDDKILTHESLGAEIIRREFSEIIRGIRRNPNGNFREDEVLSPDWIAYLIVRPKEEEESSGRYPYWLRMLRGLFSGLYTIDNMDFVLRDAYMSGYSHQAFDIDRLLHYSFFTRQGLTIHRKGLATLIQFLNIRGELFRQIYFHRKVRAIDITLKDLFESSMKYLFPYGNPVDHLSRYLHLTEWSLLTDVSQWSDSEDETKRKLAPAWTDFLNRKISWRLLAEKQILFRPGDRESGMVFADERLFETAIRDRLPAGMKEIPLRFDIARHYHRPGSPTSSGRQNFLFDPSTGKVSNLESEDHYRSIPKSFRICRIYGEKLEYQSAVVQALAQLTSLDSGDDLTNM